MLECLLAALKENQNLSFKEKLKLMKDTFLTHRQIGESECYYRLLPHMHLSDSNLGTTFIHTGFNKSRFLRRVEDDEFEVETVTIEGRDGNYVESSSIHDKYLKRPPDLFFISLSQFAKCYTPSSQFKEEEDSSDQDVEIDENVENKKGGNNEIVENRIESDYIIHPDLDKRKPLPKYIKLVGKFYKGEPRNMRLRNKRLVIRYHKFKRLDETHEYCFSELELYFIFKDDKEREKCLNDPEYCYDFYMLNRPQIKYVKAKVMPFLNQVEEGIELADKIRDSEIGDILDPENEQGNEDAEKEGITETDEFVAFDYDKLMSETNTATNDRLFKRVEIMDMDLLMKNTRELDDDQLFVVNTIVNYAKKFKRATITNSAVPDPLFLKVFGSAGTGKSHVINLVSQWTEQILRCGGDNLDCPYIIRTSFTGSAASAIGGQTLHSSFALNFSGACNPLDDKKRDKMRHVLRNLRVCIVDEFR